MDRAEGALLVAEKALAEIGVLRSELQQLVDAAWDSVRAGLQEAIEAKFAERPEPQKGADGDGVAGALIDREGCLVLTLSNGETRNLGKVVGDPGRDGFSLDDFDCQPVDDRTIKLMFTRGDEMHSYELEFPVITDCGVFKEGEQYVRGNAVTWGGSLWIAQRDTSSKPDAPDSGFRLAVKRGRDGKDFKPKDQA